MPKKNTKPTKKEEKTNETPKIPPKTPKSPPKDKEIFEEPQINEPEETQEKIIEITYKDLKKEEGEIMTNIKKKASG